MEELHDRIAVYLRGQRRIADVEREARILGIWRERCDVPCCRICGRPISDSAGLYDLAQLRAERVCAEHSVAF